VIVDIDDPSELMAIVRFERRLGDLWSLEANLRAVMAEPDASVVGEAVAELQAVGLERWHNANEFNLTLSRFF